MKEDCNINATALVPSQAWPWLGITARASAMMATSARFTIAAWRSLLTAQHPLAARDALEMLAVRRRCLRRDSSAARPGCPKRPPCDHADRSASPTTRLPPLGGSHAVAISWKPGPIVTPLPSLTMKVGFRRGTSGIDRGKARGLRKARRRRWRKSGQMARLPPSTGGRRVFLRCDHNRRGGGPQKFAAARIAPACRFAREGASRATPGARPMLRDAPADVRRPGRGLGNEHGDCSASIAARTAAVFFSAHNPVGRSALNSRSASCGAESSLHGAGQDRHGALEVLAIDVPLPQVAVMLLSGPSSESGTARIRQAGSSMTTRRGAGLTAAFSQPSRRRHGLRQARGCRLTRRCGRCVLHRSVFAARFRSARGIAADDVHRRADRQPRLSMLWPVHACLQQFGDVGHHGLGRPTPSSA